MAPLSIEPLTAPLRAVTHHLSSAPSNGTVKDGSEAAVLVHKFKTQISTMLQARTVEERWAAVALIKTVIEIGEWEVLRNCEAWVRGLLGILNKPDPESTKKLCIITLTRIFLLTHQYQTLVREITTPSLPAFIASCLNLISTSQPTETRQVKIQTSFLTAVLEAFCHLLPRHTTLFRPFIPRIRSLLLPLVAPTPSNLSPVTSFESLNVLSRKCAQRLFVLLHYGAPKNLSSEEWTRAIRSTIDNLHDTADQVFRAIFEDWESVVGTVSRSANPNTFGDVVCNPEPDGLLFPSWTGIQGGVERMVGLLELMGDFLAVSSSSTVHLPLGQITDLLTRVLSLTVPAHRSQNGWQDGLRLNPEIGKEEREGLWAGLPQIHVGAIAILEVIIYRLDQAFIPLAHGSLDQITWVFEAEAGHESVRIAAYSAVANLLELVGPSLSKTSVSSLSKIICSCCDDLLPLPKPAIPHALRSESKGNKSIQHGTRSVNADSFLAPVPCTEAPISLAVYPHLHDAASHLLPVFFLKFPVQHLSVRLRTQIDRTAILTGHKKAMLASVLNPPPPSKGGKGVSSISPFLAGAFPGDPEVEAILRPRMPIIRTGKKVGEEIGSDEENDEQIDTPGRYEDRMNVDDNFLEARQEERTLESLKAPPTEPSLKNFANDKSQSQAKEKPPSEMVIGQTPIAPQVSALESQTVHPSQPPMPSKRAHSAANISNITEPLNSSATVADTDPYGPPSPKRLRAKAAVEPITWSQHAQTSDRATANAQGPLDTAANTAQQLQPDNQPPASNQVLIQTAGGGDSDSSDFEIPKLTMEQDTDEEDEGLNDDEME
ncbi:MAG: hypothetical protein M1827_000507 [Pycnora praestabilis]|nr:MAG: hypothetical protein M1827_000507 [Pycnora praestabilis]